VIFTVSGIDDSEYDDIVEEIELFIKKKGPAVHTGIGNLRKRVPAPAEIFSFFFHD